MYAIARLDGLAIYGDNEVTVPELDETFILAPITARVWRLADGRTSVTEMAAIITKDFQTDVSESTIWSALDCLAEAQLLTARVAPPACPRADLMTCKSRMGGLNQQTRQIFAMPMVPTPSVPVANDGEQSGKREEEGRKQEQGSKEQNDKYMERQSKQQEQNQKQVEQNQKREQSDKEQMNKRR